MRILLTWILVVGFWHFSIPLISQEKIVDQVIAVVGNNIVLTSDVETQYLQMRSQGMTSRGDMKCEIFEDLLAQRLMLNQAIVDSIEVSPSQVEQELNQRLQMFIEQIGSEERLEAYYNKSMLEIKDDFRDLIRDQILTRQMQSQIAADISVTPTEVKSFYRSLPTDSLPTIPAQVEYKQLVRNPPYSEQTKLAVRERLLELRRRIIQGEDFSTLAILYSEDPGSATQGGELGFLSRNDLVKEFADAAFALKPGAVSAIVETSFGFHLIQMIERKGERVNVRHILIKPKITSDERNEAFHMLDSLAIKIREDSLTFEWAVRFYSQDEDTQMSGGVVVNPNTGDAKFQLDQLDQATAEAIQNLQPGEVSDAFETTDLSGNRVFKIVKVVNRIPSHKADLKNDYSILQEMTKMSKQQETFNEWIEEKIQTTYVHIDDAYKGCRFRTPGWVK
jgi:peptidyl-prolyl cis-trans isomerase SurA